MFEDKHVEPEVPQKEKPWRDLSLYLASVYVEDDSEKMQNRFKYQPFQTVPIRVIGVSTLGICLRM